MRERIFLYNATEDEKELYEFDKKLKTELESMNALHASLLKDRVALTAGELEKLSGMGVDVAVLADPAAVAAQAAELQEAINLAVEQGAKERAAMEIEQGRKAAAAVLSAARGQLEKARKIEDIKINLIPDVPLREFEQAKAVLARHLADAQEEWAGNNEVLQLLQQAHDREMLALVDEFYRAKAAKDAAAFDDYVSIVQAGFSSNIGDIMAKNADVAGSLGDLQAEEDALRTSYNKRKIDYQELQDGLLEISKRRAEAEKQINRDAFSTAFFGQLSAMAGQFAEQSAAKLQGTLSSLPVLKDQSAGLGADLMAKETQAKRLRDLAEIEQNAGQKAALLAQEAEYQEEIGGLRDAKSKKDEEVAAANKQAWAQAGVSLVSSMGASYAKLKAEGASTQKALAVSALGGLKAQIPIYAAQIVGAAFSINPFLGVASLVALPLLYAGLSKAEAAVGAAKFFTGGIVEARSSAERRRDGVPIWANHGEGIMPNWLMEAGDTREALLWSLRKRRSLAEYYLQDKGYVFERVVEADRRLQEVEFARQVQIVNANLVKMHRMQEAQFALVQQELVGTNNRLERLEHADFNKNINIDANINTDLKGAFVDVEFRRRVASGR